MRFSRKFEESKIKENKISYKKGFMKIFAKVNRLGTKSLEILQFCVKYDILCIVDFPKSNVD